MKIACVYVFTILLAGCGDDAASSSTSAASAGGAGGSSSSAGAGGTSLGMAGGSTTSSGGTSGAAGSAGAAASGGTGGAAKCTGSATYQVTVNVTWDDVAVSGKHYTTIIGAVHSPSVVIWQAGEVATDGVKDMAEMGSTQKLGAEVGTAVTAGTAASVVQFGGGDAPGTSTGQLQVSGDFSRVSFGSMIAPSPDWFIGVSNLDLCEAGAFVTQKSVDAVVYDAGTKEGAAFDYGFPETNPRAPIGYALTFLDGSNPIPAGTIAFQKL